MRRVLIVDDEAGIRRSLRALLQSHGWEVADAGDANSGVEEARSSQPDLIFLDVQMTGKSGFDAYAEIAEDESLANAKVVFLTGVAEKTGMAFSAKEVGEFYGKAPAAYLEKPFDAQQLLDLVNSLVPPE